MILKNLKKLVEAETPLKFRIKDEQQSEELQEFFFTLGKTWISGSIGVTLCDRPFFYYSDVSQYHSCFDRISVDTKEFKKNFEEDECKEYDLENDCLAGKEEEEEPICLCMNGKKYKLVEV